MINSYHISIGCPPSPSTWISASLTFGEYLFGSVPVQLNLRGRGEAGAIVSGSAGTAKEKIDAFQRAGVGVARIPSDITGLLKETAASL